MVGGLVRQTAIMRKRVNASGKPTAVEGENVSNASKT